MPCFRPTPLKRPELSWHIAKARNVVAPTAPKNRGGLPCHAIGEGFPRLLKSSLPACLRSRAKGRSLTRLTMSWRPIRNLSDTVTGKSEHLLRYRIYARSLPNLHRLSCSPCRNAFAPPAHRVGTTSVNADAQRTTTHYKPPEGICSNWVGAEGARSSALRKRSAQFWMSLSKSTRNIDSCRSRRSAIGIDSA